MKKLLYTFLAVSIIFSACQEKNKQRVQTENERIYKEQLIQKEYNNKEHAWDIAFQTTSNTTVDMGFTYWKLQAAKENNSYGGIMRVSHWKKKSYVDKLSICRNAMAIQTGFYFTAEMTDEVRNNSIEKLKYKTAELLICIEEDARSSELDEEIFSNLQIRCMNLIK